MTALSSTETIRVHKAVHHLARELFVYLSQQDGRPLSAGLVQKIREYGVRCYIEGLSEAHREPWLDETTSPTVPAPAPPAPPKETL